MAPQRYLQGERETELSRTTGTSSNTPPAETQPQWRHHLVHSNAANAAPDNMTLDSQSKIVLKTKCSKNKKQDVIGCKCSCIEVHGRQQMIQHPAGVPRDLRTQFIAARNGKPPLLTKAFVSTVCNIDHDDAVSSASAKNISVPAEWLSQSGRAPSEPSETPQWRTTPRPASIQHVAFHITL